MLIVRTAFKSVPNELYEAAQMDGATHFQTLLKVGIPLVKATLSVILLYSMVGAWNEYFNSMIYLRDKAKYPLQLILRTILLSTEALDMENVSSSQMIQQANDGIAGIKYALIVMSTLPILVFYLVIQKSFKKGIMVGSVKG
jgi:putative aldouronate transport system permease protein